MDGSSRRRRDEVREQKASSAEHVETADPHDTGRQRQVLRHFSAAVLAVYWVTLFVATHVPLPEGPMRIPGADKAVHFVGYGMLGLLFAFWVARRRPLTSAVAAGSVLLLAGYGVIDELLQIPVGRSCELADWICDLLGAACGVLLILLIGRLQPRVHPIVDREDATQSDRP